MTALPTNAFWITKSSTIMPAFDEEAVSLWRRCEADVGDSRFLKCLTRMGGSCAARAFSPACARAYAYDDIAREEDLTLERVHEIVREALR